MNVYYTAGQILMFAVVLFCFKLSILCFTLYSILSRHLSLQEYEYESQCKVNSEFWEV